MKSKFEIYDWWKKFDSKIKEKGDIENIYKEYYAEDGFEFNSINDSLYKMFDKQYDISIGDNVYLDDYYKVCDKWLDLESDCVHFMLAESGEQWKEYVDRNYF